MELQQQQRTRHGRPVCKPSNAGLLGLLALTVISGFIGGKAGHIIAGALLTGGIIVHAANRRKAL